MAEEGGDMASQQQRVPLRQRRPSTGAPLIDIQGSVGPAGISRPKHKRTITGFGADQIKSVEGEFQPLTSSYPRTTPLFMSSST